jgi:hypothetical protein
MVEISRPPFTHTGLPAQRFVAGSLLREIGRGGVGMAQAPRAPLPPLGLIARFHLRRGTKLKRTAKARRRKRTGLPGLIRLNRREMKSRSRRERRNPSRARGSPARPHSFILFAPLRLCGPVLRSPPAGHGVDRSFSPSPASRDEAEGNRKGTKTQRDRVARADPSQQERSDVAQPRGAPDSFKGSWLAGTTAFFHSLRVFASLRLCGPVLRSPPPAGHGVDRSFSWAPLDAVAYCPAPPLPEI